MNCDSCGEEILNARQIVRGGRPLCRGCAGDAYYEFVDLPEDIASAHRFEEEANLQEDQSSEYDLWRTAEGF